MWKPYAATTKSLLIKGADINFSFIPDFLQHKEKDTLVTVKVPRRTKNKIFTSFYNAQKVKSVQRKFVITVYLKKSQTKTK